MQNYPPFDNVTTHMRMACLEMRDLVEDLDDPLGAIRLLLHDYTFNGTKPACFDMHTQIPAGRNGTISGGDWSGCGSGKDGEAWDFQTCSFLVDQVGTNGQEQDFLTVSMVRMLSNFIDDG